MVASSTKFDCTWLYNEAVVRKYVIIYLIFSGHLIEIVFSWNGLPIESDSTFGKQ